jgi:hypothetical protein
MKRSFACCVALLVGASAIPLRANSVYVPLALNGDDPGISYRTQLWVTNPGDQNRRFDSYLIPTDVDGTDRPEGAGTSTRVLAGTTIFVQSVADAGDTGMLEISGPLVFVVKAELTSFVDGVKVTSIEIPALSPANSMEANSIANLLTWERSNSVRTDFGLINLAHDAAQCEVSLLGPDSETVVPSALIPMPPLSQRYFADILGTIGMPSLTAARAAVTCDQPFYAFLLQRNVDNGGLQFTGPAPVLANGFDDNGPPAAGSCTPGAVCFQEVGTFHTPSSANPVRRLEYPVPGGEYSRLRFQLDFRNGGWYAGGSQLLHDLFWMVRNANNRDMFGYLNFWGPNRNQSLYRHGIGLVTGDKPRLVAPATLQVGETYHVDYIYDTAQHFTDLKVTNVSTGALVVEFQSVPNVNSIHFGSADRITIDFGFVRGVNPLEVPTYGWDYQNLLLELFP